MPNYNFLNRLGIPQLSQKQMVLEIAERIHCAKLWCLRYSRLFSDPTLHSQFKFQLYKFFVRPILTYGCEVWALDSYTSRQLLRFEKSILKEIYKSKYPPKHLKRLKPNMDAVYKRYRSASIIYHVTKERLRWNDLILCEKRALKQIYKKKQPRGKRVHWRDH